MEPGERESIIKLAKTIKEISSFEHAWALWKGWDRFIPPIVVEKDGSIVGFNACRITSSLYICCYYVGVSEKFRRLGIG